MTEVTESLSSLAGLNELFKQYSQLEKRFGEAIWSQIGKYFPDNFDVSSLSLDSILADIKWNRESGNRSVALRRIDKTKFDGKIKDLYQQIKILNGRKIDGFFVEVEGFNLNDKKDDHHLVNIRFVKEDDISIDLTSAEKIANNFNGKLLKKLN